MLEKFFEAPEPKQAAAEKEDLPNDNLPESLSDPFNFDQDNKASKDESTTDQETKKEEDSENSDAI